MKLGEICSFLNGGTPSKEVAKYFEGDIPWITGADILGPVVNSARSHITEEAISASATNRVPTRTVLLVTRTSVGKVAISGVELCYSQDITALKPNLDQLNIDYLVHFLRSQESYLKSQSRGATIKGITKSVLQNLDIPLPPIATQKHIAAILDQAEELRSKRRSAIALLDELGRSVFLEMFGDPVINPKGWDRVPFGELLSAIESGKSPNCLDRPVAEGEWGVLKLGAVTWCEYNSSENKALPFKEKPDPTLEVKSGDLLFTRKNTYELVAACVLVRSTPPNLLLPDLIFRFRLKSDAVIDLCFLHQLLINPNKRREIQKLASGSSSSMPNISKSKLQITLIEVPPLALQQQFAKRMEAIETLKATHRQSLAKLDSLFASLQSAAFNGELRIENKEF